MIAKPRASIAHRLQSRVAFKLDHLFGDAMPHPLRRVAGMRKYFPWTSHRYLAYRKWLGLECSDFVLSVLTDSKTHQREYLRPKAVARLTASYRTNDANWLSDLDAILSLELLHRSLLDG